MLGFSGGWGLESFGTGLGHWKAGLEYIEEVLVYLGIRTLEGPVKILRGGLPFGDEVRILGGRVRNLGWAVFKKILRQRD